MFCHKVLNDSAREMRFSGSKIATKLYYVTFGQNRCDMLCKSGRFLFRTQANANRLHSASAATTFFGILYRGGESK